MTPLIHWPRTAPPGSRSIQPNGPRTDPLSAAQRWLDEFFDSYHGLRPVHSTFIGVRGHDHRLPDYSENGWAERVAHRDALLHSAASMGGLWDEERPDARSPVALDVGLARGFLELQAWEDESAHFHRGNPSLHTGEAIFGVMGLYLARSLPARELTAAAVSRMNQIPVFLETARDLIRSAPAEWSARAARECEGALSFFGTDWQHLPDVAGPGAGSFGRAARRAAEAFAEHLIYLRDLPAVDTVACGEEALSLYLRRGHFLEHTAQDVVEYARMELERAHANLEAAVADLGHADVDEALTELSTLHPTPARYYEQYREVWEDTRAVAEFHELLTWPDFPIEYVPRPRWSRGAAPSLYFLFYRSPPAVNRSETHHYLVTPIEPDMPADELATLLTANNDSVIKLNHVLHHGSIGHHVQNWHAFRAESRVGRIAAVDCASRIAMFSGLTMAEGWACYATDLMGEFGMFTPLERVAELRSRTRMCARAIVDMELHQGHMGVEDAVTFYRSQAGMPEGAARTESVKNSMFPAAALIYLMGSDRIRELRGTLAKAAGDSFSLRDFHDRFLSFGSVPVSLIAEAMTKEAAE